MKIKKENEIYYLMYVSAVDVSKLTNIEKSRRSGNPSESIAQSNSQSVGQ